LLIIPFPSEEKVLALAGYLNDKYGVNYLLFNLSEHEYNIEPFKNQVTNCSFPGYPCPPLEAIFILLKQMDSWLQSDPANVLVINCQATMARSFVLAAEYLCFCRMKYKDPIEALNELCDMNGFDPNLLLFPSQQLYFNYFSKIFQGFTVISPFTSSPSILH